MTALLDRLFVAALLTIVLPGLLTAITAPAWPQLANLSSLERLAPVTVVVAMTTQQNADQQPGQPLEQESEPIYHTPAGGPGDGCGFWCTLNNFWNWLTGGGNRDPYCCRVGWGGGG